MNDSYLDHKHLHQAYKETCFLKTFLEHSWVAEIMAQQILDSLGGYPEERGELSLIGRICLKKVEHSLVFPWFGRGFLKSDIFVVQRFFLL